ncbi:MAG TPA: DNA polymerase III subunit delta' [Bacillota bacterium]
MKTWAEVAEVQPLASKIMTNSIQRKRVSHAYLLQGDRGTGKEAIAELLAKTLFCKYLSGTEPCHTCNMCKRIESRNHPDVHWIEPEGQSIKIEQIKKLQKEFIYSGLETSQKVYIIKGADTLTLNAANRILKFLEEPKRQTTAMMLTENSQSIIPTIRSRCQVIDLKPLHPASFQKQLIEAGMSEREARFMSALTNNFEEAMTWSHDEWFAQARKLMIQLIEKLSSTNDDAYLFIHQYWLPHFKERKEQEQGLDFLLLAFKDILYFHMGYERGMVVFSSDDERLEQFGLHFSREQLIAILHDLLQAKKYLKQNVQATLVMEQLTLQIQR